MALRQDSEPAASSIVNASASNETLQNMTGTSVATVALSISTTVPPTIFPPPPRVTTTLNASAAAWLRHESKLTASERSLFLKQDIGQLGKYLADLRGDAKKLDQKSHGLRFARSVEPIVQFVDIYAPIAQTVAQGAPAPAAFVVGGITCILSVPTRFLEYQDTILGMLSQMGVEFKRLSRYENTLFKDRYDVQAALFEVYGDILDFCREAANFLYDERGEPRTSLKLFAHSLWKPCQVKLGAITKKFELDLKTFENSATQAVREDAAIVHANLTSGVSTLTSGVSTLTSGVSSLASAVVQMQQEQAHMKGYLISIERRTLPDARRNLIQDSNARDPERRKIQGKINRTPCRGEKRDRVLAWIPSLSFAEVHCEKSSKRLEGTGQWLLENEKFQDWKNGDSESGILCVQGKSGSGKSCLAALVIQDLQKEFESSSGGIAVAYAYCSSLEDARWDPKWLLGSILNQIQSQVPDFAADRIMERIYDQNMSKPPSVEQLEDLILKVSGKLKKVFIVVDGLDECHRLDDMAFENLCKSVRSFAMHTASVAKVVVFSRPRYVFIEHVFRSYPHISVDKGENEKDIEKFISNMLSGDEFLIKKNKKLLAFVEKTLLEKADGMFLWVSLLAQSLKSALSASEIKEKMGKLPPDLYGVYEVALRRILSQESRARKNRALKILLWVTNAKRPLSVAELMEALAIEIGSSDLNTDEMIETDEGITAHCGDLITLSDGYYYPLHSSLQDYLSLLTKDIPHNSEGNADDGLEEYRNLHRNANRLLGEACLTYLQFDKYREGPIQDLERLKAFQQENPFFSYAASYWGSHVVSSIESDLQVLVDQLLSCDEIRELSMQQYLLTEADAKDLCPYNGSTTPLHVLAKFNLTGIADSWPELRKHKHNHKSDSFGLTPLDYALRGKSREMCSWLLEGLGEPVANPEALTGRYSGMHLATFHDWGDIVERLIALGCDIDQKVGELQQSPLHVAAAGGCQSALEALLRAKATVDTLDSEGQTPLVDAAEGNHQNAVSALLKAGADVNRPGWQGLTALHRIALHGNLPAALELFQYKPKVDVKAGEGWSGRTPFHLAAEENHPHILRCLHTKGAAINATCGKGFTAFLLAATSGSLEALNYLIGLRVSLDVKTEEGDTALHLAAGNGHHEVVKALCHPLKAHINSVNQYGYTPLHLAVETLQLKAAIALLEGGAATETTDGKGQTVLHRAILEGNTELVEQLTIRFHADKTAKGILGSSPLHYAAHCGQSGYIKFLIGEGGANPDAVSDSLQTAVQFAARQNNINFIKELLVLAPNVDLEALDKWNQSALHKAANEGASDVVKFLVERKVTVAKNLDGNLPLHLAAWYGCLESVKALRTDENVNKPGFRGRTALHGASTGGHVEVAKFLTEFGADVNQLDEFDQTILYASFKTNNNQIADLLLDNNVDTTTPTRWGRTSLHEAALLGNKHVSTRLLDKGCDGLALSVWGETPFYCAVESDKLDLVQAFLDHGWNGTNLANYQNATCFFNAVQHGNMTLFEKLLEAGKDVGADIHTEDFLKRGLMWAAASGGQVEMIDRLRALGFDFNGSKGTLDPPLCEAASAGYPGVVSRLVELNADLEVFCANNHRTALTIAASGLRPRIFRKLLEAGANPLTRDKFGLNALDYASRSPETWNVVPSKLRDAYQALDPVARAVGLKSAIRDYILAILEMPEHQSPPREGERVATMIVLSRCVLELEQEPKEEPFSVLINEVANPAEICHFCQTWICEICEKPLTRDKKYLCSKCYGVSLCEACFEDYLKGGDGPQTAPKPVGEFESLERELQSIRMVAETYYKYGTRFMLAGLEILIPLKEWIVQKTKLYNEWEAKFNKDDRYKQHPRPGWKFLKLIEKGQKLEESLEGSSTDAKNEGGREEDGKTEKQTSANEGEDLKTAAPEIPKAGLTMASLTANSQADQPSVQVVENRDPDDEPFIELDNELSVLCRHHRADRELSKFICSNHEYVEIPYIDWTKADLSTGPHDARGKISREWLTNLLAKYPLEEVVTTAGSVQEVSTLYDEPAEMEQVPQHDDNDAALVLPTPRMALPKRALTVSQLDTMNNYPVEEHRAHIIEEVTRMPPQKMLTRAVTEILNNATSPTTQFLACQVSRQDSLDLLDKNISSSTTGEYSAASGIGESIAKPSNLENSAPREADSSKATSAESKQESSQNANEPVTASQSIESQDAVSIVQHNTAASDKDREKHAEKDATAEQPFEREKELRVVRRVLRFEFNQVVLRIFPKREDTEAGNEDTQMDFAQKKDAPQSDTQTLTDQYGRSGGETTTLTNRPEAAQADKQGKADRIEDDTKPGPSQASDADTPCAKAKEDEDGDDDDDLGPRENGIVVQMLLWNSAYEYLQAIWLGSVKHKLFSKIDAVVLFCELPLDLDDDEEEETDKTNAEDAGTSTSGAEEHREGTTVAADGSAAEEAVNEENEEDMYGGMERGGGEEMVNGNGKVGVNGKAEGEGERDWKIDTGETVVIAEKKRSSDEMNHDETAE